MYILILVASFNLAHEHLLKKEMKPCWGSRSKHAHMVYKKKGKTIFRQTSPFLPRIFSPQPGTVLHSILPRSEVRRKVESQKRHKGKKKHGSEQIGREERECLWGGEEREKERGESLVQCCREQERTPFCHTRAPVDRSRRKRCLSFFHPSSVSGAFFSFCSSSLLPLPLPHLMHCHDVVRWQQSSLLPPFSQEKKERLKGSGHVGIHLPVLWRPG